MKHNTTAHDSLSTPIHIAISTEKFASKPSNINWSRLNDSFQNVEIDPMALMNNIFQGHPFCPQMDGRRSIEHFRSAQYIGIDLDTGGKGSSLAGIAEHKLYEHYSALAYETPSSTPEHPRSRVLFLLAEPMTNAEGYRAAIGTMTSMFQEADPACVDPARFFYGNGSLQRTGNINGIIFNDNPRIELPDLRRMYRQVQEDKKRAGRQTSHHYSATDHEVYGDREGEWNPEVILNTILPNAYSGNRNRLGHWYACRLAENHISRSEAEQWMHKYQIAVETISLPPYTAHEASSSLASAYK